MLTYEELQHHRIMELGGEITTLASAGLARRRASGPRLNLARMLLDASAGKLNGEDREALEENARAAGIQHPDPQRPYIPFAALRRDLTAASGGAGGFLTGTETQDAIDILRPWSVTARAGLLVEAGLVGGQAIPKTTAKSTPVWLSTEGTQVTPSTPTLGEMALTPKQIADVVNFSRQLARQANAEAYVRRELRRTIGTAVDQGVINGSGAAGQPTGILLTTGVQTQSGTTLNTGVNTMKQKVVTANVADERIAFLSTPAIRELLENRERVTGSGRFVWDKDQVADRPAFVSTDVPAATMICGDFGNVYFGIWGAGFVVEINPFDPVRFKTGVIQARIILSCDIAVLYAAAFCKAESIT